MKTLLLALALLAQASFAQTTNDSLEGVYLANDRIEITHSDGSISYSPVYGQTLLEIKKDGTISIYNYEFLNKFSSPTEALNPPRLEVHKLQLEPLLSRNTYKVKTLSSSCNVMEMEDAYETLAFTLIKKESSLSISIKDGDGYFIEDFEKISSEEWQQFQSKLQKAQVGCYSENAEFVTSSSQE